ncbi:MAG: hypothetical protein IPG18_18115, partial [Saprospiraceae bacterium]|nr:hypothetical protein [Saprospiraceae bacterium]
NGYKLPGIAQFSFTSSETGCSNTLNNILIHPTPEVEITGEIRFVSAAYNYSKTKHRWNMGCFQSSSGNNH